MATKLRHVKIQRVALVDEPASQTEKGEFGAFVELYKRKADSMKECPTCGAAMKADAMACPNGHEMAAKAAEKEHSMEQDLDKLQADLKAAAERAEAESQKRAEVEKRLADVEQAAKGAEELQKRLLAAEAEIAKAKDEKLTAEFVEKAKAFSHLPGKPEDFGPVLKRVAGAVSAEDFAALETALKAANEAAAPLFKEKGRAGAGSQRDAASELIAKAREIANASGGKLNELDAYAKAAAENPELYDRVRRETARRESN